MIFRVQLLIYQRVISGKINTTSQSFGQGAVLGMVEPQSNSHRSGEVIWGKMSSCNRNPDLPKLKIWVLQQKIHKNIRCKMGVPPKKNQVFSGNFHGNFPHHWHHKMGPFMGGLNIGGLGFSQTTPQRPAVTSSNGWIRRRSNC